AHQHADGGIPSNHETANQNVFTRADVAARGEIQQGRHAYFGIVLVVASIVRSGGVRKHFVKDRIVAVHIVDTVSRANGQRDGAKIADDCRHADVDHVFTNSAP